LYDNIYAILKIAVSILFLRIGVNIVAGRPYTGGKICLDLSKNSELTLALTKVKIT
jgi:hypothetical protein